MTASRRLLYGETSRMHCSGVILAHSSTQTVFKSWRFRGPLLWTLIFSSFHRFSIGFKSGDWLGHSSSFIFFLWNQLRVSLAVCLGSLSCWNVHPRFIFIILVDGSRYFIKNVSAHFSIHPSFNYVKFASTVCWKAAPHHDVPTSKLHCWYGVFRVMCSAICPPNMVCIMASKEFNFALIWPDYILPVFHRLVQMLCSKL